MDFPPEIKKSPGCKYSGDFLYARLAAVDFHPTGLLAARVLAAVGRTVVRTLCTVEIGRAHV